MPSPFEFHFELEGGDNSEVKRSKSETIVFKPPLCELRYFSAIRILEDKIWRTYFKKVIDFGCAQLSFVQRLRHVQSLEYIVAVDADGLLLQNHMNSVQPWVSDNMNKRLNPLIVEVYSGRIECASKCLLNADAVIGLEIIEHLDQQTLDKVPQNIFGFIHPKLAIFSTPNIEYNVLFNKLLPNGLRHWDHKFEWTRAEFKAWAYNICKCYPNYKVAFIGVGKPPTDRQDVGYATQIAIFARLDTLQQNLVGKLNINQHIKQTDIYKLLHAANYPYKGDESNNDEQLLREIEDRLEALRLGRKFFSLELNAYKVPLRVLMANWPTVIANEFEMKRILLVGKYNVQDECLVFSPAREC